jgi:hypothetical protein
MDDVLQSIDANVRHAFVDYILSEFKDWQLIFTTHDRLWRDQLRDLFDAHQHQYIERIIYDWSFDQGPRLTTELADPLSRDLTSAITTAEPRTIGALAGQLLEAVCDQLTKRLRLKIARKQSNDYTLGDLWPAVREWLSGSIAENIAKDIAMHKYMRNITVHADSASQGISLRDARNFANSVLSLYSLVRCNKCASWIRGSQSHPACPCGALKF